jgi:hypothetical protein
MSAALAADLAVSGTANVAGWTILAGAERLQALWITGLNQVGGDIDRVLHVRLEMETGAVWNIGLTEDQAATLAGCIRGPA